MAQSKDIIQQRSMQSISSRYSDGTTLQLEDVFSQVIDILFHSLGSLSSALSAAGWLLRNTDEGTPVSAITTLSEAFGVGGLYHQYYMIRDFDSVERV